MNAPTTSAFEQRAAELLQDSAERVPAAVRSRLTQARYAALAAAGSARSPWRRWSRWVPAGAVAGVVLALVLVSPHWGARPAIPEASGAMEDIELLADSGQVATGGAGGASDYDFYEWAADQAAGGSGSDAGT